MPALSPTMKEGTIASWNVKPGDELQAGDVIASIQTDKAVVELEAQEPGFVAKLYYEAGASNIPIGTVSIFFFIHCLILDNCTCC